MHYAVEVAVVLVSKLHERDSDQRWSFSNFPCQNSQESHGDFFDFHH